MFATLIIGILLILLILRLIKKSNDDLNLIPGPSLASLIWTSITDKPDREKFHLTLTDLVNKYGPILRIPDVLGRGMVVVSDYDYIYQVLVKKGRDFGGRVELFHIKESFHNTGIVFMEEPNEKWRHLRKIVHSHLRQFGEGMTELQSNLNRVGEDMFEEFAAAENEPCDPREIVERTTLKSIVFLVSGHIPSKNDPIVDAMTKVELLARELVASNPTFSMRLLNALPWVRYTKLSLAWTKIGTFKSLQVEVMELLEKQYRSDPERESFCKVFMEMVENDTSITKQDIIVTLHGLLIGGTITSKETFYAMINLLAHNPQIQSKMFDEIQSKMWNGKEITYSDRHRLHYCKAVLLETLRYHSVASLSLLHRTCVNTTIGDFNIPAGTNVITLLWKLHHDLTFWKDPHHFRPERFLDSDGKVVPTDHPNRQHLMPFGAGTRVCVAETMATARLFLWMTSLVRRFSITPSAGNEKSLIDVNNYNVDVITRSQPYKVIFSSRDL